MDEEKFLFPAGVVEQKNTLLLEIESRTLPVWGN